MIKKLNMQDLETAKQALQVQIPAYMVEAELIGCYDLPPLRDSISTLQACGEIFLGYYEQEEIAAFLSYEMEDDVLRICRMVVHPHYHRRGIASRLIQHVVQLHPHHQRFIVTTGAKNMPAIELYEKHGFLLKDQFEVLPDLMIARLEKYSVEI